jgi:hypothetical protein
MDLEQQKIMSATCCNANRVQQYTEATLPSQYVPAWLLGFKSYDADESPAKHQNFSSAPLQLWCLLCYNATNDGKGFVVLHWDVLEVSQQRFPAIITCMLRISALHCILLTTVDTCRVPQYLNEHGDSHDWNRWLAIHFSNIQPL